MNFKSLNGYFGRDMSKYYKEGKGFTIGFASDVIATDDMMNIIRCIIMINMVKYS